MVVETKKIRFARRVFSKIVDGEFNRCGTVLNWMCDRAIIEGGSVEDGDRFELVLAYRWFGRKPQVWLRRYSPFEKRLVYISDLSDNEKSDLLRAWKFAVGVQKKRQNEHQARRDKETRRLSWWP